MLGVDDIGSVTVRSLMTSLFLVMGRLPDDFSWLLLSLSGRLELISVIFDDFSNLSVYFSSSMKSSVYFSEAFRAEEPLLSLRLRCYSWSLPRTLPSRA